MSQQVLSPNCGALIKTWLTVLRISAHTSMVIIANFLSSDYERIQRRSTCEGADIWRGRIFSGLRTTRQRERVVSHSDWKQSLVYVLYMLAWGTLICTKCFRIHRDICSATCAPRFDQYVVITFVAMMRLPHIKCYKELLDSFAQSDTLCNKKIRNPRYREI